MTPDVAAQRRADWRVGLSAYLNKVARKPFRPGSHDCALFVAGAVEAMTGADLAAQWRGYKSLEEGRERLSEAGYGDHVSLVASLFNEVAPSFAQVGDIVVLPADTGASLGIVQGEGVYCLTPAGLAVVSRMLAERAFRV